MSLHLQRFVDRVQSHESRGTKDFVMSMTDARAMHAELTRLLLELTELLVFTFLDVFICWVPVFILFFGLLAFRLVVPD